MISQPNQSTTHLEEGLSQNHRTQVSESDDSWKLITIKKMKWPSKEKNF